MDLTREAKYLIYKAEQGMYNRYGEGEYTEKVVRPRLKYELKVIISKGYASYFLILADVTDYCRREGIPIGPGRGSAGGSVLSYVLGITEVDPLKFDLVFERFLNPERVALPDIDTDFAWSRRQDVLDYVTRKYGSERVAQIVTFGTLAPKKLLDDLGRVLHIPKKDIEELKAIIGDMEKPTLEKLAEIPEFMEKLHEVAEREPRLVPAMIKLVGLHRNASMHAGGVIIADRPMDELAPTVRLKGKGRAVVAYEMTDAEAVGLLKMDLLGLKTLDHIEWAEQDVRKFYDPSFQTRGYRLDDQAAFDIINRGDTAGIFQLEGAGITRFAQELKVESFNDIVALLALYRPGPLDSGAAYSYIRRKNGEEPVEYPHPDLEPILKDTYGIIIYQEQVMFILGKMAGYSMGQADKMRKAMGKKDAQLMEEELRKFKEAAMARGYDEETCNRMAELIETFGRYGFNKSHAVAYSYLTYWTAVLKARWPDCFYAGWLNTEDSAEKIGAIVDEAIRHGVKVLPPDVNKSSDRFTVTEPGVIRFGLEAVKGFGKTYVRGTITNRKAYGPFLGFADFCRRCPSIPINAKKALVAAGAFDFDRERGWLLTHAETINTRAKSVEGTVYLGDLEDTEPLKPLELGRLEKEHINYYVTANPIHMVQEELRMMGAQIGKAVEELSGQPLVGGEIKRVTEIRTKKGDRMAFVTVDDGVVALDITFFPEVWARYRAHLQEGGYVAVQCRTDSYRGKRTLNALEVWPIDLEKRDVDVTIHLGRQIDYLSLAQLKYLLENTPKGDSQVKLEVIHGRFKFLLKSDLYQIQVTDDFLDGVEKIFGPNSISLRGRSV